MNEEYNNSKSVAYIRITDYSFAFFKRGLKPEGGSTRVENSSRVYR